MSRVGIHQNDFFFIFSLSRSLPTYFGWERSYDGVFRFFEFFCYFFAIFYYESRRNTSERLFLLSLFPTLSQPILAWKKCYKGVFKLFEFFCFFFRIFHYGSGWHTSEQFFFIFSLSRPFPTYFGLKWSYDGVL